MVDCHPLKSIVNLGSASVDNVSSGWQSTMSPRKECDIYILSNLNLNRGIDYVYVMVDFICIAFFELQGAVARITKWKIIAHSETRTHDHWVVKRPP